MNVSGCALVTGGGQGVGRGIALAFAKEGAAGLTIAGRTLSFVEDAVKECTAAAANPEFKAVAVQVDISEEEQVSRMLEQHVEAFGRLDYAANCAGKYVDKPYHITELPLSEFEKFYQTNIRGTLLYIQAEIRQMMKQDPLPAISGNIRRQMQRGSIVNISAVSSTIAMPNLISYTVSKHTITGLTKNAALDAAEHQTRVNSVCPTWIATDKVREFLESTPELHVTVKKQHPLGRIAEVEEVADHVVIFLSSPRASYISGVDWNIDGASVYSRA